MLSTFEDYALFDAQQRLNRRNSLWLLRSEMVLWWLQFCCMQWQVHMVLWWC